MKFTITYIPEVTSMFPSGMGGSGNVYQSKTQDIQADSVDVVVSAYRFKKKGKTVAFVNMLQVRSIVSA